jgi:glycerophosphoryl diester phosphodiesterase
VDATFPFFAGSTPLVFAHRGGAALAPENTMAAFDNAVDLGVDGIELDVRLSRDRAVAVLHDATLDRTTALGGPVSSRTAGELRAAGVPMLGDVLARHPGVRVIVELKENAPALARAAVDAITAANATDRVCVGSFGRLALRTVRAVAPSIATSASRGEVRRALYRSWCRWPVRRAPYGGYQVPERAGATRVVSPRFVADAHRAGLKVQVWTVNSESDARRLLAWDVDALITDCPDVMMRLIR